MTKRKPLRSVCRWRAGAGLVVLGLLSLCVPLAHGGDPLYVGHGQYTPSVRFEIKRNGHGPGHATFETRVGLFCDDGTFRKVTPDPISLPFTSPKNFEGSRHVGSPGSAEVYYRVRGQLQRGGRARGVIVYFLNEAESGAPYRPDCKTTGLHWRWHAKRK
jgi:hypothetical protein